LVYNQPRAACLFKKEKAVNYAIRRFN
jgi:hypothetical protein